MPYPQNLETALEVEGVVRRGGAVPATIAVIGGRCCVGKMRRWVDCWAVRAAILQRRRGAII